MPQVKKPCLTIYLAGKVGGTKHKIRENLNRAGRKDVDFVCSDGSKHSEHLWGAGPRGIGRDSLQDEVADRSLSQLFQADMLFAYFDCPTSFGSIAEIAYMSAMGKPCLVTVCIDSSPKPHEYGRNYEEMCDAYWFVCCLPHVRAHVVDGTDAATGILDEFLTGYYWNPSHRMETDPIWAELRKLPPR